MEWQDLRAVRAAVRHGSVTAAAAALDRTRPALSRRIARLERQLGTPLLVRTPRRCEPTDAGRIVADAAARAEAGWRAAVRRARAVAGDPALPPATPDRVTWSDLAVLRAVHEHGGVTAAARELRLARPAVYRRLARLHRVVGVALLVPRARVATVTPAGHVLLAGADQVDAALARAAAIRRPGTSPPRPRPHLPERLRLAFGLISPQQVITRLRAAVPAAAWQWEQVPLPTAVRRVHADELDLFYGWSTGPATPRGRGPVRMRSLLVAPYAVAAGAGHWAARRAGLRMADLAGEEWVVDPDPVVRDHELGLCRRYGFVPQTRHVCGDPATIRALVGVGQAVSWVVGGLTPGDDYVVVRPSDAPLGRLVLMWNARVLTDADAGWLGGLMLDLNLRLWREREPALTAWLSRHATSDIRRRLDRPVAGA
ncbi:LysR family transcriptional regulator [Micromonospora sp. R77]|uniref:LysR family transcriptional regulator n=1 Tax=Micromonospora sp. R77 TaxID=2925836 RepID=UPI001F61D233|nr:LysR family transcriptional regulator [Micromonospora sp. R77]MCI4066775.1 LysR family transcriptional regulator [Micromonospora sp. R77]